MNYLQQFILSTILLFECCQTSSVSLDELNLNLDISESTKKHEKDIMNNGNGERKHTDYQDGYTGYRNGYTGYRKGYTGYMKDNMNINLKNGYNNGYLNNGYSNGDINNGYSRGVLNNGYSNRDINNGYSKGVLNNGYSSGVKNNAYRNGSLNGLYNGLYNGFYDGVLNDEVYHHLNTDNGYSNGVYHNLNNGYNKGAEVGPGFGAGVGAGTGAGVGAGVGAAIVAGIEAGEDAEKAENTEMSDTHQNPKELKFQNVPIEKKEASVDQLLQAAPGSDCERCTENVDSLSSHKIGILLEAMRAVHASHDWEHITSVHGEPVRPECDNQLCCIHSDDGGFLPWHRVFINIMNEALQKYESGAIIPYWDWTTSDFPMLAGSAQIKNPQTGQYMENPFFRGFQPFSQNFSSRSVTVTSTSNNLRDVLAALEIDDFLLFSTQLNFVHAGIHRYVGGTMARLDLAAYDPIFYMHHAFIDLVWAVYQKLKPNSRPSDSVLQQRLLPFGMTVDQTLTLTNERYNLDMNSDKIVFGGMTLAQIQNRISRRNQESGARDNDRIYAGFFLRSFKTSAIIKFNVCNLEDCSYPGGEVFIFGGKREKPYINSNPAKVDVTEAVINARITKIRNIKFMVTSFKDLEGYSLQFDVYQPIRIARSSANGEYAYCIFFDKTYILPPQIRIPKYMSFEIQSPYKAIYGTENENNYLNCDSKGAVPFPSSKPIDVTVEQYYFFDDNCRPQSQTYSVSKINIIKQ